MLAGPLPTLIRSTNLATLRAVGCDCLANIGPQAFEQLSVRFHVFFFFFFLFKNICFCIYICVYYFCPPNSLFLFFKMGFYVRITVFFRFSGDMMYKFEVRKISQLK